MKLGPQHQRVLSDAVHHTPDRNYRRFLLRVSPPAIRAMFEACFANGPRKGGQVEALAHFDGNPQHPAILSTVPVVEECDRYMAGFIVWLASSGYGNDLDMIKAFARWHDLGAARETFRARMHS